MADDNPCARSVVMPTARRSDHFVTVALILAVVNQDKKKVSKKKTTAAATANLKRKGQSANFERTKAPP
jgi:hypothetical protein